MLNTIQDTLTQIEREHNIRILYAVESGSRAWGFASPDSDYDVRYIYVRPREDYLRLDPFPDTIEGPLDETLDFSGWDIRKTLALLRKTNPSLMEWCGSPIVYRTTEQWEELSRHFADYFSPQSNMHHYLSMTIGNWQRHMKEDRVKLKKYLYVLRPLLCCRWLEKFGTVAPVPFDRLCREVLPPELEDVMADLLRRKQSADEAELTEHIPVLDEFIGEEIPRIRESLDKQDKAVLPDWDGLNRLFLGLLENPD